MQNRLVAAKPSRTKTSVYTSVVAPEPAHIVLKEEKYEMDVDKMAGVSGPAPAAELGEKLEVDDEAPLDLLSDEMDTEDDDYDEDDWLRMTEEEEIACADEIAAVREAFQDEVDLFDTTMVAEYADDIFEHMEELEVRPAFLDRSPAPADKGTDAAR